MKNRLFAFASTCIIGLCLVAAGTTASHAQNPGINLLSITEDTFIRIPALEFTVATVELDHFLASVPLDFSRTERALSQVRPGVDYNDGMIWLTFKTGRKHGLISQIRNLRLTRRSKSTYRLAARPRYNFAQSIGPSEFSFNPDMPAPKQAPSPRPRPNVATLSTSQVAMSQSAPGILTVDHHSAIR